MICASLYRAVFIKNLLKYLAEKFPLMNTTNLSGITMADASREHELQQWESTARKRARLC